MSDSAARSVGWIGAAPSSGSVRVIARNVGDTVQVYGPGSTATVWAGAINPLPDDFVIGTFSLTLTNVVIGSAIQIETQAGATIVNRTATGTTEVFSLSAYKSGSAYNDLRVKVRKGTGSPFYRPYETLITAFVGAQSIYVSQIQDE